MERSDQWKKQVKSAKNTEKQAQVEKVNSKALKELEGILTNKQLEEYKQLRKELNEQWASQKKSAIVTDEDQEMEF